MELYVKNDNGDIDHMSPLRCNSCGVKILIKKIHLNMK